VSEKWAQKLQEVEDKYEEQLGDALQVVPHAQLLTEKSAALRKVVSQAAAVLAFRHILHSVYGLARAPSAASLSKMLRSAGGGGSSSSSSSSGGGAVSASVLPLFLQAALGDGAAAGARVPATVADVWKKSWGLADFATLTLPLPVMTLTRVRLAPASLIFFFNVMCARRTGTPTQPAGAYRRLTRAA
jgi:hypothetical protein